MTGNRETARLMLRERRSRVSGWPTLSSEDGKQCLGVGTARLLSDGVAAQPSRTTEEESVGDRRLEQWAPAGLDARSHIRQEDHRLGLTYSKVDGAVGVRDIESAGLQCEDGSWRQFVRSWYRTEENRRLSYPGVRLGVPANQNKETRFEGAAVPGLRRTGSLLFSWPFLMWQRFVVRGQLSCASMTWTG